MITDLFDQNTAKILTLFSISPGSKFLRNELKEKTKLNNWTLDGSLLMLLKNKILLKEKRLISLNLSSPSANETIKLIKREHARFKELPLEIYFPLMDASYLLSGLSVLSSVYLFGSYAKLIYTNKSDIDLAVISAKLDKAAKSRLLSRMSVIEKKYGKNLELHFFEQKDMQQKDPIIKEIKTNSITLF